MLVNQIYKGVDMLVSKINYEDLTQEVVDKILYKGIEDLGFDGDCIMVLGSNKANLYRIPKAVEIYNTKRSNKLLLSGGDMKNEDGIINGANSMRERVLDLGVSSEDIILEDISLTTKENMICSLLILERTFKLCNVKRILLVTTRFQMRRSLLMAASYMPKWIEFCSCPADDVSTLRHNWYLTESGRKRALGEAFKISSYIREGSVSDFEI